MTAIKRGLAAAGLVAAGALFLAACGDDDMDGTEHGSSASRSAEAEAGTETEAGFNDADVAFAQMMIPHHEQALEMAELADGRASDAEVKDLAGKIEKAQGPEIRTMKGWLKEWKQPTAAESMPGMDHGSGHGGDGMMSGTEMTELKALKGTAFDKAFAEMMIEHHNGAISMAEDERKNGESADAKKMAEAIVEGQSAEVEQLQDIVDRL
ncbi:DUF305 domain-containing protein [Streptomyces cinnabarinus]|uniref:DUF305 domain-containing protein n=1 Tax=Streptomyces cinnabarinus TaxID=67287 RepID=A0ABY7KP85_9ACTN|nr:DUF305 domain-containing protein [Streptomyces cinnabarinus]WAZ24709.1 DUF305 domain-containing protein [Streptomyces cinnabarinus]